MDGLWFSFSVKFGFQGFIWVNLEDGLVRFPLASEGVFLVVAEVVVFLLGC